jgi:hypothetical protein
VKRAFVAVFLLLAAQGALAQNAIDVGFASFRPKKTVARTGEDFTMRVDVANRGPDDAPNVRLTLTSSELNTLFAGVEGPAGWDCGPLQYTATIDCSNALLPAGADHELRIRLQIPMYVPDGDMDLTGRLFSSGFERNPADNFRPAKISVHPSEIRADLELTIPSLPRYPIGSDAVVPVDVTNAGPHDARNVLVVFTRGTNAPLPLHAEGEGWACEAAGAEQVACTRPLLAAKTSAPITFRVPMSLEQEGRWYFARGTAELVEDAGLPFVVIAPRPLIPEKTYQQILIPLVSADTPGANGALWKNELRMIVDGSRQLEIHPNVCDFLSFCDRVPLPLGRPFDPRNAGMIYLDPNWRGGQFLYINSEDADSLRINARVYDASRDSEGAGAEIPIPRQSDFTSGTIALFDIPLAAHLRHNLRIYDDAGRPVTAIIHVFADDETTPRATVEYGLRTHGNLLTSMRKPVRPGYVEVDPTQFADLAGAARMRVEIEPRNGTDRLWAFLTVTNVETHQVTAFTPQ